jgi:hypothetical protein
MKLITSITYTTLIHYYMHYLAGKSKIRKLTTDNRKRDPMTTSSNEFHQVMPFSLFHCAPNVPQTKIRRALRIILTHRNKTEMPYQVMREIAENGYPYIPIDPLTNTGFPDEKFMLWMKSKA